MTKIIYNSFWEGKQPKVTIITPVFNRRRELPRALASVEVQTYKDFEHIIVDDGSSEGIDDIMEDYMGRVSYPVAFIKKENGGVHTARNAGLRISRGEYYTPLDSDDELLPEALMLFINAWAEIPANIQKEYREVTAFCVDQNGKRLGGHLPHNINSLPYTDAKAVAKSVENGDKKGMLKGDLMRENLWPEPEGVTFVTESINWTKLGYIYKTWFIDDVVYVAYHDTVSLTRPSDMKVSNQKLINNLYNNLWYVNNGEKYGATLKQTLYCVLWHCMLKHLLRWRKVKLNYPWVKNGINSPKNRIAAVFLWGPAIVAALLYNKKHS